MVRGLVGLAAALAACSGGGGGTDAGAVFPSCPGSMPPPGALACRGDGDCGPGAPFCIAPGEFAGCGVPPDCTRLCETSADCTDMAAPVCIEDREGCNQACFTPPTVCVASCTITGCATSHTCDPVSGRCDPIPCELGWACPPSSLCDSGFFTADEHGCVRRTCMVDGDCDCGTCVFDLCQDTAGTCMPPVA